MLGVGLVVELDQCNIYLVRARFSDDIDSGRPESSQLSGTQSSTMDMEDQMGEAWGCSDGDEEDEARE